MGVGLLTHFIFLGLTLSSFVFSAVEVQNVFEGPVKFAVWQHWQPSWNVERQNLEADFRLEIGRKDNRGYLKLLFKKKNSQAHTAVLWGEAFSRTGEYEDQATTIAEQKVVAKNTSDGLEFLLANNDLFLDVSGTQIVTKIAFRILDASGNSIYEYTLVPMFVRGSGNFHWGTKIDPYMAHAGSGDIAVSNGTTSENSNKDYWNGVLVRPSLQFIDRNILASGAEIGLHRHEANQEMWLVEAGEVKVSHGMAPITEYDQKVSRKWDTSGQLHTVVQHIAEGGWIEERALKEGEYAVIVPNPTDKGNVCAHGLLATKDSRTFTMGTKN